MFQKLGKFEIKGIIGQGSMGEVYLGVDPTIGREVAIKTILSNSPAGLEAKNRFAREARAAGLLNHPNLVTIHEFGEDQGVMYIAMEYLKGHDLEELMLGNALSSSESLEALAQVCDGLAFAHKHQIVHRDIKPSNVRVLRDGSRMQVKVMDFGVARVNNSDMTATGMVMGTVSYMAPEYIRTGCTDPRSDLFAVGVMLYETLSGRKPFSGGTMPTILYKIVNEPPEPIDLTQLHDISPLIRSVLDRALCKDPDLRYQTAEELAIALRAAKNPTWTGVAQGDTVQIGPSNPGLYEPYAAVAQVPPHSAPLRPPPLPDRSRAQATPVPMAALIAVAALVLLLLLGGGAYGYRHWKRGQESLLLGATSGPESQAPASGRTENSAQIDSPPGQGTLPQGEGKELNPTREGQGYQPESANFEGTSLQRNPGRDPRGAARDSTPSKAGAEVGQAAGRASEATKPLLEKTESLPEVAQGKHLAWAAHRVYKSADPIEVFFNNVPENRQAWIDISKAEDRDGKYRQYYWTYGKGSGKMTFSGLNLEPGIYEVRVHFSRSNSVDQRSQFRVE